MRPRFPLVGVARIALLVGCLSGAALPPAFADPVWVTEAVIFSTEDQSMWAPGQDAVLNKAFSVKLVDIDTGLQTIGEIDELSATLPNPKYLAWKVAYDACRVAFSDGVCRNGATLPFVGHVGGLGNAPPQKLNVSLGKNGLLLTYDLDLEAGFSGAMVVDGGKVDVSYPTDITLQADKAAYAPGELVTLSLSEIAGIPTMATEFSDFDASLSAFGKFDAYAAIEAYLAGAGGVAEIVDVETMFVQELFGASIGNAEIGLRIFGEQAATIDTTGGIGTNIFKVKYPPDPTGSQPFRISLADFQIQVPDLDTPPNSSWDGTSITNTQLPIDRGIADDDDLVLIGGGAGFHPTDFGKIDIDVDGILTATGVLPIPLGLSASLEGNLLDFDLGAFFGLGQTMTFTPLLTAQLNFSTPVLVETSPDVFTSLSTYSLGAGELLSFRHPGVDLQIDPVYSLDNEFTNITEFLISPVATVRALQLSLSGLIAGAIGADFDAALVHHVISLGDPISAAQFPVANPFALEGFQSVAGSGLHLGADIQAVPEPSVLAVFVLGVGAAGRWRRRLAGRTRLTDRRVA
jgi:hypothetical protein